jgi:UDP-N-acetylmuramate--alanine ligase
MHIHFIGIGGSGLSAIARLLLERGNRVSGSDLKRSSLTDSLQEAGAHVVLGHQAESVDGADFVVRSSAIPDDNIEVVAARRLGIPVLKRADYLGKLMAESLGIAVAGTHGKTTTSAMIAWMLTALNQDPSFIVGGVLNNLGTNARAGNGRAFVIEADEYDYMFLGLSPTIAVVTNVEHDHPDLFPTSEAFYQAFLDFIARLSPGGKLVIGTDDPGSKKLSQEAIQGGYETYTFGLQETPSYQARNLRLGSGGGYIFDFVRGDSLFVKVSIRLPGKHNVQNAVAALAAIDLMDLSVSEAALALKDFRGAGRRFQVYEETAGITVIDDYAHHPTEIRATLEAARDRYPNRGLWAVWQPHTFFRTRVFFDQFVEAFSMADHVLVTEIFSAREQIPSDFSARQVVAAMDHTHTIYIPDFTDVIEYLLEKVKVRDIVLILSAGDADEISGRLLARLRQRNSGHSPQNELANSGRFERT